MIRKAFKYRIYPNKEQQESLAVQFGHARYVFNHFLNARQLHYKETGKGLGYCDNALSLTLLKKELVWLKDAGSQVLQQSLKNLDVAFNNFFKKRARYPKFKSKYNKQSILYPQGYKILNSTIYLPKVGLVKVRFHRAVEGNTKSVTVSKTKSGNYYISIACEVELSVKPNGLPPVGIDVGLKDFAVLSTGERISNPRYYRESEKRLARLQKSLSKKKKGSNNRTKARIKVARFHEHTTNQRKDFLHKVSYWLTTTYGLICMEDLNVRGMVKNHCLAKAISDVGWSMFKTFVKYKSEWYGSEVKEVDRFYPSSKTCSVCGSINKDLTLSIRQWTCSTCSTELDRDINAAINILKQCTAGTAGSKACGEDVRPKTVYSLRQTSMKQEAIGSLAR